MTIKQIQAIGNFLQYYHTDLVYIEKFQNIKQQKISQKDYIKKEEGTFYSFLTEFRVARNYKKGTTDILLSETLKWVSSKNANDVDLFAKLLSQSDLTRGNITTSLASKILFLNNPWKILPMDTLTRKAFNQAENKYSVYMRNIEIYRKENKPLIEQCIKHTNALTALIEQTFLGRIKDLHIIRENRIIDKLLWSA